MSYLTEMAAAAASAPAPSQINLGEFPALRKITLWLVQSIDHALQTRIPDEMGSLHVKPFHFVIKGGAAAEIQLGTTNYTDIDTGLYMSPFLTVKRRREIRTSALNILLDTLISIFQNDELDLRPYVSELTLPLLGAPFQNRVMYEAAFSPSYAHTPEPAFVGRNGVALSNNCPFGIWIRENVMAGPKPLEMDIISVVVNVNLRKIQHRVVLDIAIPHIPRKNAHAEFTLSTPMIKRVEGGIDVPIEKSLALFVEQYAASRSPEINASKTARRANRASRLLERLRPMLTDKAHPIYKNMEEIERLNDFFMKTEKLSSGDSYRNVVGKVREKEPLVFSMFDTANLPNNEEEIPILPMTASMAGASGARGGGQAQATRRRAVRRRRGTQRRK